MSLRRDVMLTVAREPGVTAEQLAGRDELGRPHRQSIRRVAAELRQQGLFYTCRPAMLILMPGWAGALAALRKRTHDVRGTKRLVRYRQVEAIVEDLVKSGPVSQGRYRAPFAPHQMRRALTLAYRAGVLWGTDAMVLTPKGEERVRQLGEVVRKQTGHDHEAA